MDTDEPAFQQLPKRKQPHCAIRAQDNN